MTPYVLGVPPIGNTFIWCFRSYWIMKWACHNAFSSEKVLDFFGPSQRQILTIFPSKDSYDLVEVMEGKKYFRV